MNLLELRNKKDALNKQITALRREKNLLAQAIRREEFKNKYGTSPETYYRKRRQQK